MKKLFFIIFVIFYNLQANTNEIHLHNKLSIILSYAIITQDGNILHPGTSVFYQTMNNFLSLSFGYFWKNYQFQLSFKNSIKNYYNLFNVKKSNLFIYPYIISLDFNKYFPVSKHFFPYLGIETGLLYCGNLEKIYNYQYFNFNSVFTPILGFKIGNLIKFSKNFGFSIEINPSMFFVDVTYDDWQKTFRTIRTCQYNNINIRLISFI